MVPIEAHQALRRRMLLNVVRRNAEGWAMGGPRWGDERFGLISHPEHLGVVFAKDQVEYVNWLYEQGDYA